jgi:alpha-beta hydrolase superfamily lysophospholipase
VPSIYKRDTEAKVYVAASRDEPMQRVVVIFPPYFTNIDIFVAVDYAERGVSTEQIYSKVMAVVAPLTPPRLAVYGPSMGGMVAVDFLKKYEDTGAPYGQAIDLGQGSFF